MSQENENRNRVNTNRSSSSSRTMESLSLEINRYPRDLLQRFMSTEAQQQKKSPTEGDEAEEEIELNLGLSLGGRFGVDKSSKKLTRSSSIAGSIPLIREHDAFNTPPAASYPLLMRTSSLPTETEEEWRKRKEMQSLRRLEAKRRRSEKQKNLRGELNSEGSNMNRGNWTPSWVRQGSSGGAMAVNRCNTLQGLVGQQQGSQGSVESQGGSSSSLSEMESKIIQGTSSGGETRSSASNQSLQDRNNQDALGTKSNENISRTPRSDAENPSKRPDPAENRGKEIGTNAMEDMPCVFTIGDGPNGRRVEGILYKYGKGEEVRIMCVCHGSFLSPAEFVKHAGGRDVDHPLKHIVVNTSGTSFL